MKKLYSHLRTIYTTGFSYLLGRSIPEFIEISRNRLKNNSSEMGFMSKDMKKKVLKYLDYLEKHPEITEEDITKTRNEIGNEKYQERLFNMKNKHKPIYRDNNGYINGTGIGGNKNKIRIPSKKHKNRFKQFLKLFPKYKDIL